MWIPIIFCRPSPRTFPCARPASRRAPPAHIAMPSSAASDAARRRLGDLSAHLTVHPTDATADTYSSPEDLRSCRAHLAAFIDEHNCHPIMVRLAWHDAGTFDASSKRWPDCGGANGSIRFDPEMEHAANAGLARRLPTSNPSRRSTLASPGPTSSTSGGATAVEDRRRTQDPPMRRGRVDVSGPEQCRRRGTSPASSSTTAPQTPIRTSAACSAAWVSTDREIVALSGGAHHRATPSPNAAAPSRTDTARRKRPNTRVGVPRGARGRGSGEIRLLSTAGKPSGHARRTVVDQIVAHL